MLHSLDWTNLLQCQWPHLLGHTWRIWTTAMIWFLLRLASFSLLWTRLCMKEAMASRKTWKPTTTYSGRRWFPHLQTLTRQQCYRSDIDMFIGRDLCWRPQWHFHLNYSGERTAPSDLFQVNISRKSLWDIRWSSSNLFGSTLDWQRCGGWTISSMVAKTG